MLREFFVRLLKPTPKFFKKLRNIGLGITSIGMAILTAPVSMPVGLISIGGYLVVSGSVMGLIAQSSTDRCHLQKKKNGRFTKGMIYEDGR